MKKYLLKFHNVYIKEEEHQMTTIPMDAMKFDSHSEAEEHKSKLAQKYPEEFMKIEERDFSH